MAVNKGNIQTNCGLSAWWNIIEELGINIEIFMCQGITQKRCSREGKREVLKTIGSLMPFL